MFLWADKAAGKITTAFAYHNQTMEFLYGGKEAYRLIRGHDPGGQVKTTGKAGGFDFSLQIDGGIHAVNIALVEFPPQQLDGLPEALEVDDLPLPEELDDVVDVRIIAQTQDVVVGDPGLLLWHA